MAVLRKMKTVLVEGTKTVINGETETGVILHAGSGVSVSGEWSSVLQWIAKQKELSGKSRSFLLSWVHLSEDG